MAEDEPSIGEKVAYVTMFAASQLGSLVYVVVVGDVLMHGPDAQTGTQLRPDSRTDSPTYLPLDLYPALSSNGNFIRDTIMFGAKLDSIVVKKAEGYMSGNAANIYSNAFIHETNSAC
ncbi:hypothetical protein BKA70DRAFT_1227127 [Coprinopsis sp. MPI-PUGE-AT-0042]|nr:hypothetical protein BKA70DRAFT_1227127 [Coprinopsis sp. MPI-PUGE-AT-0042]